MFINDVDLHAQGKTQFIDDLPEALNLLHVYPVVSTLAHAVIININIDSALHSVGVVSVLLTKDIKGINNIGNIETAEVLLANEKVVYQGQPLALVVANTAENARLAAKRVHVQYEELPAVFDARDAYTQGLEISPARIFSLGDVQSTWQACDVVVEGSSSTGAQEHSYLETQVAIAYPTEN
ncbi:partial Aldehyde oxidoreductase, partial [Patescibacteria group bacterium]